MSSPTDSRLESLLAAVVAFARRAAGPIVLGAFVAAIACGLLVTRHARVDTDTSEVLARELAFRQANLAYRAAFPALRSPLVVIVEGANPDAVADGADRLVAAIRARADLFGTVLYPAGEPFFRRNGLLYQSAADLSELSDRLAQSQPFLVTLAGDPSLRGLFDMLRRAIEDGGDELAAATGMSAGLAALAEVIEARSIERRATLSWTRLMAGGDAALTRRLIVAETVPERGSLAPAERALAAVRRMAGDLGVAPANGLSIALTGEAALETEELRGVFSGTTLAGVLSLVAVGFLVVVGMRSLRLVAAVMATLLVGLVLTAAAALALVGRLNLISVYFAVLFVGIAVDFGIHFALRYKEQLLAGRDHDAALARTAAGVGPSLLLAGLAAIVAFLSFLPTSYRGVAELGLISAAGMVVAVVTSLTLLPALLTVLPGRRERGPALPPAGGALDRIVRRHPRAIALCALALALACLPLLPLVHFERNPLNLRDPASPSVVALRALMRDEAGARPGISFVARDLEAARALAARIAALPTVAGTVTAADLVPPDQEQRLAIVQDMALFLAPLVAGAEPVDPPTDAERRAAVTRFLAAATPYLASGRAGALAAPLRRLAQALAAFMDGPGRAPDALADLDAALTGSLPARIDALREALQAEPVTLEALPPAILRQYLAEDGRARVEVRPRADLTDGAELRRFVGQVTMLAPGAAGPAVLMDASGDVIIEAFATASAIALALIAALLLVRLRSALDAALVLAPLALAALLTFAVSALFGPPVNLANIIVLPLLLGLGVSSGIYLVTRAREETDGNPLLTVTPRAVLFSALTTIASFGSLAVTDHVGTASLGLLLLIAIGLSLACTLVVLPALLALRYRAR